MDSTSSDSELLVGTHPEYLVYSLFELYFNVDIFDYEMEVLRSIGTIFTTKQVIEAVTSLQPNSSHVELECIEQPCVMIRKLALDRWAVTLCGSSSALKELTRILGNSKSSNSKTEDWRPIYGNYGTSLLSQCPPDTACEMMPQVADACANCDPRPLSSENVMEKILLLKVKVTHIIGSGGCRVSEIRQLTGCTISIPPIEPARRQQMRGLPANEVVQEVVLRGTVSQVALAKSMIRRVLHAIDD